MWEGVTVTGGPGGRYSAVYGVMDTFLLVSHGKTVHTCMQHKVNAINSVQMNIHKKALCDTIICLASC